MRYFGICIHLFVFIPSVITLQLKMSERQDCRFIRRKGDFMNNNQTSAVNNTANKTFTTKYMVELAAMIAIIIIMAFTPLGYIKLPGLTITFFLQLFQEHSRDFLQDLYSKDFIISAVYRRYLTTLQALPAHFLTHCSL